MAFTPLAINLLMWTFLFGSMIIFTFIMRDISRRMGEALHMRRYYLLYDLGIIILLFATVMGLESYLLDAPLRILGFDLTIAGAWALTFIAITIDLTVTVKYWGWLLPELLNYHKK